MPPEAKPSPVLELGPVKLPLPKWAVAPFTVVVLVGVIIFGGVWVWEHFHSDATKINPSDLVQLEHAQRHIPETPSSLIEVFNDARGRMLVKFFESDSCTLVERHFHNNSPTITRFVPDLSRTGLAVNTQNNQQPRLFGPSPAYAQGRCIDVTTHPGTPQVWNEALNQCQVKAWRSYPDGCRGFSVWDGCASTMSAFQWVQCVH